MGSEPLVIGGVRIDTPEIAAVLRETGNELALVALRAAMIDDGIAKIIEATESAVENLQAYNKRYGLPPRNASLAQLGGSPLRGPSDFKALVGRRIGQRLSAAGIQVEQLERQPQVGALRALVDKVRGLSLLALVQNWRTAPELPVTAEPEAAA